MGAWLEISRLHYRHRDQEPLLEELSLSLSDGRIVAVCGRSGVGKSTLLALLAGHLKPTSGRIEIKGEKVEGPSARRTLVFQDHNLFPWLTAENNVAFGLRCRRMGYAERMRRAKDLLAQMGLLSAASLYPHQLSGGMQQRVGIARALAVEPDCLLMDEPFSALDAETKAVIVKDISQISASNDIVVVMVTHNPSDCEELADHILTLKGPAEHELRRNARADATEANGIYPRVKGV